eukprot:CAMPEP_0172163652 /NCGR_PEP_ID=MMETSP1050-20130122/7391_1 /TAXON_ID=233186 /ORGANISM="Cryptomonas curvata, Strain CCAP979/52" /LENGTH=158 /DNA_ID=CAMNT_0012833867 /DNA_START=189 /DNA_END=662 /DNA_ORIENTATION=-
MQSGGKHSEWAGAYLHHSDFSENTSASKLYTRQELMVKTLLAEWIRKEEFALEEAIKDFQANKKLSFVRDWVITSPDASSDALEDPSPALEIEIPGDIDGASYKHRAGSSDCDHTRTPSPADDCASTALSFNNGPATHRDLAGAPPSCDASAAAGRRA